MADNQDLPIISFASREAWLEENHTSDGPRLKLAKKGSGIETVSFGRSATAPGQPGR